MNWRDLLKRVPIAIGVILLFCYLFVDFGDSRSKAEEAYEEGFSDGFNEAIKLAEEYLAQPYYSLSEESIHLDCDNSQITPEAAREYISYCQEEFYSSSIINNFRAQTDPYDYMEFNPYSRENYESDRERDPLWGN